MKIEAGKKYRVNNIEKSILETISSGFFVKNGDIRTVKNQDADGFILLDDGYIVDPVCLEPIENEMESTPVQSIAENLWQTLCAVKQALDSGAPIDKEYIAKVLAENRPEEIEPLT